MFKVSIYVSGYRMHCFCSLNNLNCIIFRICCTKGWIWKYNKYFLSFFNKTNKSLIVVDVKYIFCSLLSLIFEILIYYSFFWLFYPKPDFLFLFSNIYFTKLLFCFEFFLLLLHFFFKLEFFYYYSILLELLNWCYHLSREIK